MTIGLKFVAQVPKYNAYADVSAKRKLITFMRKQAQMVKKDFEKTVTAWKKKPKFDYRLHLPSGGTASIIIFTNDKLYNILDKGVKKHKISPKTAGALSFSVAHAYVRKSTDRYGNYEAATSYKVRERKRLLVYGTVFSPKRGSSYKFTRNNAKGKLFRPANMAKSGQWQGYIAQTKPINWPGIKPFHWTAEIGRKWRSEVSTEFKIMIEQAQKDFYPGQVHSIWEQ